MDADFVFFQVIQAKVRTDPEDTGTIFMECQDCSAIKGCLRRGGQEFVIFHAIEPGAVGADPQCANVITTGSQGSDRITGKAVVYGIGFDFSCFDIQVVKTVIGADPQVVPAVAGNGPDGVVGNSLFSGK